MEQNQKETSTEYNGRLFLGVDPGASGCFVWLREDGTVHDIKLMPRVGLEFDLLGVQNIMNKHRDQTVHAVVEKVHAIFGSSASATFSFGEAFMLAKASVGFMGIPYTLVPPSTWQKEMHEGVTPIMKATKRRTKTGDVVKKKDPKATSLVAATRLFPDVDMRDPDRKTDRAKKLHDGVIDAILMASYCRRKFK